MGRGPVSWQVLGGRSRGADVLLCSYTPEDTQFPVVAPFPRVVPARPEYQCPPTWHGDGARYTEA